MTSGPVGVAFALGVLLIGCSDDDGGTGRDQPTTTTALVDAITTQLGALHRSAIEGAPDLVPLFYHHPDGWAVEDVSLDGGDTWCRHAWYTWSVTDATSIDDFTVVYAPTYENPDCAPLGQPLVLHITETSTNDQGLTTLSGEYTGLGSQVTRTVCEGTIDDWADVCGVSSGLGAPTTAPPP